MRILRPKGSHFAHLCIIMQCNKTRQHLTTSNPPSPSFPFTKLHKLHQVVSSSERFCLIGLSAAPTRTSARFLRRRPWRPSVPGLQTYTHTLHTSTWFLLTYTHCIAAFGPLSEGSDQQMLQEMRMLPLLAHQPPHSSIELGGQLAIHASSGREIPPDQG
jgi:hypothetical protein